MGSPHPEPRPILIYKHPWERYACCGRMRYSVLMNEQGLTLRVPATSSISREYGSKPSVLQLLPYIEVCEQIEGSNRRHVRGSAMRCEMIIM